MNVFVTEFRCYVDQKKPTYRVHCEYVWITSTIERAIGLLRSEKEDYTEEANGAPFWWAIMEEEVDAQVGVKYCKLFDPDGNSLESPPEDAIR